LDVSIPAGWVSALAGRAGSKVVSFNNDSNDAEQLYQVAREHGLQILPLIMDFARPTPAYGLSDHCFIAATERFCCDMVFAVSLLDHIVAQRHLNFEQIVNGLAQFSKRWVVAEFVTPIDYAAAGRGLDRIPWYTLDNFAHVLGKHFRHVRQISSASETGILFLCEK
jgi:hypothetical protein